MRRVTLTVVGLLVLSIFALPAGAQITAQQKLMAKRAAELDVYRKLAERILGLKISATTSVRDFAGESDRIATHFDHFIKGARITDVRYYSDGTCEVDAEITIARVVTELKKTVDEVYRGGKWTRDSFDNIEKQTVIKVIQETGGGAVRPKSHIPDPKDEPIVAPALSPTIHTIHLPPVYQGKARERLMAKRAAELDAYRKLIERIYGLRITSSTYVRDFATESDQIKTTLQGTLRGARTTHVRYQPDGVVEVQMQVTIQRVVTTVKKVHDEIYHGSKWKRNLFDEITKRTRRKVITVVGVGALGGAGHTVQDDFDEDVDIETIIVD